MLEEIDTIGVHAHVFAYYVCMYLYTYPCT